MSVTIYHNPRCSKSRQTLALLQEKNIDSTVVEYLKTPPSVEELKHIINLLGINARDLLRTKEDEYKEYGLDDQSLTEEQIIQKMVEHPKLIERPIVIKDDNSAAIGRPLENIISLLGT